MEQIFCPHCGGAATSEDFVCPHCGVILNEAATEHEPVSLVEALLAPANAAPSHSGQGGHRNAQEGATVRATVLMDEHTVPRLLSGIDLALKPLNAFEAYVASHVDGRTSVPEIAEQARISRIEAMAVFQTLAFRDVVELRRVEPGRAPPEPDPAAYADEEEPATDPAGRVLEDQDLGSTDNLPPELPEEPPTAIASAGDDFPGGYPVDLDSAPRDEAPDTGVGVGVDLEPEAQPGEEEDVPEIPADAYDLLPEEAPPPASEPEPAPPDDPYALGGLEDAPAADAPPPAAAPLAGPGSLAAAAAARARPPARPPPPAPPPPPPEPQSPPPGRLTTAPPAPALAAKPKPTTLLEAPSVLGDRSESDQLEYVLERANTLERRGDVDGAVYLLKKAIAQSKHAAPLYNKLALALVKRREFQEAAKLLEKAVELAPEDMSYQQNLYKVIALSAAGGKRGGGNASGGGFLSKLLKGK